MSSCDCQENECCNTCEPQTVIQYLIKENKSLEAKISESEKKLEHYRNMGRTTQERTKLSQDLQYWRAERPDEWTMDEFIRKALFLEESFLTPQHIGSR